MRGLHGARGDDYVSRLVRATLGFNLTSLSAETNADTGYVYPPVRTGKFMALA